MSQDSLSHRLGAVSAAGENPATSRPTSGGFRLAPFGWGHLFLQIFLITSFEIVYAVSGVYGRAQAHTALANAHDLQRLEDVLGLSWERGIQAWTMSQPDVLLSMSNRLYFVSQFAVTTVFLFWVYIRRTQHFARVRNALLAANCVQVLGLLLYPLAPPRLVPGSGLADTLAAGNVSLKSDVMQTLNNPYSAMPSLHAAYAVVFGVAGVMLTRHLAAKVAWSLYPAAVCYSVVATGNHYVLDIVAGAAGLLTTPLVDGVARRIARNRNTARLRTASMDGSPLPGRAGGR
jgi:membrane-associated phospholipid phosphatase